MADKIFRKDQTNGVLPPRKLEKWVNTGDGLHPPKLIEKMPSNSNKKPLQNPLLKKNDSVRK